MELRQSHEKLLMYAQNENQCLINDYVNNDQCQ